MNSTANLPAIGLTTENIARVLQCAVSNDKNLRQSATQQLDDWEYSAPGYYGFLQTTYLNKSLHEDVRLMAILQLKIGVERHWRHQSHIEPRVKEIIRSGLIEGMFELGPRLLLAHATIFAKVCRIDWPAQWPHVMDTLCRMVKFEIRAYLAPAALFALQQALKELGSASLRKSALHDVGPKLTSVLADTFQHQYTVVLGLLQDSIGSGQDPICFTMSVLAIKALRQIIITGFLEPHRDNNVQLVWRESKARVGQLLALLNGPPSRKPAYECDEIGKVVFKCKNKSVSDVMVVCPLLTQLGKLHLNMCVTHPASFAALPETVEIVQGYWALVVEYSETFGQPPPTQQLDMRTMMVNAQHKTLALLGLHLLRACVKIVKQPLQTIKYISPESKQTQADLITNFERRLLTDDMILNVANVITTRFLLLRHEDANAWESEPEEWEQAQSSQGDADDSEICPCAERLLQSLFVHYKDLLIGPILSYMGRIQDPQADIMTKDQVYFVMALAGSHLTHQDWRGKFDFELVLRDFVARDAQLTGPLCKFLRRRIAILIGRWVLLGVSQESRVLICDIFRHLLNSQDETNDIVVRITAAKEFKWVAEDVVFEGAMFRPYAASILTDLIHLLREVELDETKLAIMDTMRVIIERMESHVVDYADLIMSALPEIWESAGQLSFMLKQSVLSLLQALVMSMRKQSRPYHAVLIPLIAQAVKEGSDVALYLMEEALELWSNILLHTEAPLSEELLALVQPAIQRLGSNTEHHMQHLEITGTYILLAPETMLDELHRRALLEALSSTFSDKRPREQTLTATKYTEACIRIAKDLGGMQGLTLVLKDVVESGFWRRMMTGIHDAFLAHQTTGPKAKRSQVDNLVLTDYFSILSRISIADPGLFVQMLDTTGPLKEAWNWLSSEWFSCFDSIADPNRLKLNLLGLTRLLELHQPMQELVLGQLQNYLSMWTSAMVLIMDEQDPTIDMLVLTAPVTHTEWDGPKDIRENALIMTDPVKTVNSLEYVVERLSSLEQRVGGREAFHNSYVINVDRDVWAGFNLLVSSEGRGRFHGSL